MYFNTLYCIKQIGGQIGNFAERKACVQYQCYKFTGSESNMLAEVDNKALWHNFDMLDPKILAIKLDLVF